MTKKSRMRKWDKKGVMDDAVDFLFTVMICFLLLMFIGLIVKGSLDAKNKQSEEYIARVIKVDNYLQEKKIEFEKGGQIDFELMKSNMAVVRKLGYLPGGEDDPYLQEKEKEKMTEKGKGY